MGTGMPTNLELEHRVHETLIADFATGTIIEFASAAEVT